MCIYDVSILVTEFHARLWPTTEQQLSMTLLLHIGLSRYISIAERKADIKIWFIVVVCAHNIDILTQYPSVYPVIQLNLQA